MYLTRKLDLYREPSNFIAELSSSLPQSITTRQPAATFWTIISWLNHSLSILINSQNPTTNLLIILSVTHLQSEDDADSGEQEGEECPGVEPGDGAGLDGDARVFEVVGHVACNTVYILLEAGLGTLKILPNWTIMTGPLPGAV